MFKIKPSWFHCIGKKLSLFYRMVCKVPRDILTCKDEQHLIIKYEKMSPLKLKLATSFVKTLLQEQNVIEFQKKSPLDSFLITLTTTVKFFPAKTFTSGHRIQTADTFLFSQQFGNINFSTWTKLQMLRK